MTMVVSCSPKDSTAPGLGLHPSGRPMLARCVDTKMSPQIRLKPCTTATAFVMQMPPEHFCMVTGSVSLSFNQLRMARYSYDWPSLVMAGSRMNRVVIGQIMARGKPCSSSASIAEASLSSSILTTQAYFQKFPCITPLHCDLSESAAGQK
jgi:hypothetical protein